MDNVVATVINQDVQHFDTQRKFDFIFADPPFNIGQKYDGFKDKISEADYRAFSYAWFRKCKRLLKEGGLLACHGPDDLCFHYLWCSGRFHMDRVAWIQWYYSFGQHRWTNWVDSRCHCVVLKKGKADHTWNPEDVLVESQRKKMGDKRVENSPHKGMRVPGNVWGLPSDGPYWGRVQGNNKERCGSHPNQLPELYIARLIKAYTNPGDWVFDPFAGSGTTAVVAKALGRNVVTLDISEANCKSVEQRLEKGAVRCGEHG